MVLFALGLAGSKNAWSAERTCQSIFSRQQNVDSRDRFARLDALLADSSSSKSELTKKIGRALDEIAKDNPDLSKKIVFVSKEFGSQREGFDWAIAYNVSVIRVPAQMREQMVRSLLSAQTESKLNLVGVLEGSPTSVRFQSLRSDGTLTTANGTLGDWIVSHVFFKKHVDLKWNPLRPSRTIEFRIDPAKLVYDQTLYSLPAVVGRRIGSLLNASLNTGLFLRAPMNRREKNYWLPGLNSGLPLTPKNDAVHEVTFQAHDFFHHLIPDLVVKGKLTKTERAAYVVHRMAGEAITLVLADMIFVDGMKASGVEYDFSQRKVHPLLQALKNPPHPNEPDFTARLKEILRANVRFAASGDRTLFDQLIKNDAESKLALESYLNWYGDFFVFDFKWTEQNLSAMQTAPKTSEQWWSKIRPLLVENNVVLDTANDFSQKVQDRSGDFIDRVFDEIFETKLLPALTNDVHLEAAGTRMRTALLRYMAGQLALFDRYASHPGALEKQRELIQILKDPATGTSLESVNHVRALYESFLEELFARGEIRRDELLVYREVFPQFDPFYLKYTDADNAELADRYKALCNGMYCHP